MSRRDLEDDGLPALDERYYATARREIWPWLPQTVGRMLDVGCGSGATTAFVKSRRSVEWAGGIEYVPEAALRAEAVCDRVWTGNAAAAAFEAEIEPSSLDLVLCLDVLEHLVDPWTLVRRLSPLLRDRGRLIVSVPNIRHWAFLWRLAAKGDFRYRDAGLLDRTHLRFFVRETAIELATCGGLRLVSAVSARAWRAPEARWFMAKLTGGGADHFLAKQWLVVAERA